MWPTMLDTTKEESMQCLRKLELEAYGYLVSALRAQGPLDSAKRRILKDTSGVLNISQERHKAEIRRAVNDEHLNTIAYHATGGQMDCHDEWVMEGSRPLPLLSRSSPQTVFSAIADDASEKAGVVNRTLPPPAATERRRLSLVATSGINTRNNSNLLMETNTSTATMATTSRRVSSRLSNSLEAAKKRKMTATTTTTAIDVSNESNSLAQHLLGSPKVSRSHQYYTAISNRVKKKAVNRQILAELVKRPPLNCQPLTATTTKVLATNQNGPISTIDYFRQQLQENSTNSISVCGIDSLESTKNTNISCSSKVVSASAASTNTNEDIPVDSESIEQIQREIKTFTAVQKNCQSRSSSSSSRITSNPVTSTTITTNNKTVNHDTVAEATSLSSSCSAHSSSSDENEQSDTTNTNDSSQLQRMTVVKKLHVKNLNNVKIVPKLSMITTTTNGTTASSGTSSTTNNNTARKVIPLTQLLNTKGGTATIKVVPFMGKIVPKVSNTNTMKLIATTAKTILKETTTVTDSNDKAPCVVVSEVSEDDVSKNCAHSIQINCQKLKQDAKGLTDNTAVSDASNDSRCISLTNEVSNCCLIQTPLITNETSVNLKVNGLTPETLPSNNSTTGESSSIDWLTNSTEGSSEIEKVIN